MVAQDTMLEKNVQQLLEKAEVVDGTERLSLLDSATTLIWNKRGFPYDSIAQLTIDEAYKQDSLEMAMDYTGRVIFYLTNRVGNSEAGKKVFNDFLDREIAVDNDRLWARMYINGGDSYFFLDETIESITLYSKAGEYALKANDSSLLATTKKYISDAYADEGNFAEASQYLRQAEEIYAAQKDTIRLINTRNSRANLYSRIGFFDEAKKEREEMMALSEQIGYYPAILSGLISATVDDRKQENYRSRVKNLKKALSLSKNSELYDQYEPQIQILLLQTYALTDSLEKAEGILKLMKSDLDRYSKGSFKDGYLEALSIYSYVTGDISEAIRLGKQFLTLKETSGNVEHKIRGHLFLANAYERKGDSDNALYHFKTSKALNDSYQSQQGRRSLAYYQTLYETEKRDAKIAAQESEITFLDQENKLKQQWMIFGGIGLLALFVGFLLWRSRLTALRKRKMQVNFSQKLIKGQEEERFRIARELHDGVGQKLALLIKKSSSKGEEDIKDLSGNMLDELRGVLNGLHPPSLERIGISKSLESLINEVDENTDIFFTYDIDLIDKDLDKEQSLHFYRIIQESLNNIIKHAEAKAVSIRIERKEGSIEALVSDNGKGFNFLEKIRSGNGFGMKTLLERAKIMGALINVESTPDQGTEMTLNIPI